MRVRVITPAPKTTEPPAPINKPAVKAKKEQ